VAFLFKLEHEDGTPGEPPTVTVAVPNIWGRETRSR
jgi:hypothetical protein